ncbi:prepilin-type N-terminal cleavage/methylation domain-containing protein [bacterium]|nr:prepilin-type N-terminal cleavage/methylation domain-containing protein [bacterium]
MKRRGFNLIEILCCVVIFALSLLTLLQAYLYSIRAGRGDRQRDEVVGLASLVLTRIETELQRSPENFQKQYSCTQVPWPEMKGVTYNVDEAVLSPSLKAITVTVYYPDKTYATPREYQLWAEVKSFHPQ